MRGIFTNDFDTFLLLFKCVNAIIYMVWYNYLYGMGMVWYGMVLGTDFHRFLSGSNSIFLANYIIRLIATLRFFESSSSSSEKYPQKG